MRRFEEQMLRAALNDMEQNNGDSRGIAQCRNPLGRLAQVSSVQARRKAELFCGILNAKSSLSTYISYFLEKVVQKRNE
jgi:hypothetical protein